MTDRLRKAQNVTLLGSIVNILLSLVKLAAGIFGKSAAMVADGVHSFSDLITDIVVLVMVKLADKEQDEGHDYGHGKFETLATLIVSVFLMIVGLGICFSGLKSIYGSFNGAPLGKPSYIALIAAVISIVAKELLYQYTAKVGKTIESDAVIANAWHHRSDAFSSVGTLLGIAGAMFLGTRWRILDPLAGVVVSVFIVRVAILLAVPSIKELLDASLSKEIEDEIGDVILNTPGVVRFHRLKTRQIGRIKAIEVHIKLHKEISFIESHNIATEVEQRLRSRFGIGTLVNIHTEPV